MARGNDAKEWVSKKIVECFGQDRLILADKKIYVNTTENGEPIQVCISLTCPKTLVSGDTPTIPAAASAFEPEPFKPAEITEKERDTVRELMEKLGL